MKESIVRGSVKEMKRRAERTLRTCASFREKLFFFRITYLLELRNNIISVVEVYTRTKTAHHFGGSSFQWLKFFGACGAKRTYLSQRVFEETALLFHESLSIESTMLHSQQHAIAIEGYANPETILALTQRCNRGICEPQMLPLL